MRVVYEGWLVTLHVLTWRGSYFDQKGAGVEKKPLRPKLAYRRLLEHDPRANPMLALCQNVICAISTIEFDLVCQQLRNVHACVTNDSWIFL